MTGNHGLLQQKARVLKVWREKYTAGDAWRIRANNELQELFREGDNISFIQLGQIR